MYDPKTIEAKWQRFWRDHGFFSAKESDIRAESPKFYCLEMFPYPSGRIHMGHVRNYTIGDVAARAKKMQGCTVLHPIGWDAFGLPAENAAIKHKMDPEQWTRGNIQAMRQQLQSMGFSYDWSRELATCDPEYYRWNQWLFVKMFEKGLAIRKRAAVNWCPTCQTVLANEQVEQGLCWRCQSPVIQKELEQWFYKITAYAEELLQGHDLLSGGWPEEVITMQRNWIGKSHGASVDFALEGRPEKITVFTTRPDTLFGATFMVLAPEHPLAAQLASPKAQAAVKAYQEAAKKKTKIERLAEGKEKDGVALGTHAINPVTGQKISIFIADYVLADYGTGAIMAVPAHDQRDFDFAKKYNLPIVVVIEDNAELKKAFEGEGVLVNSGSFNELPSAQAKEKITEWLEQKGLGKATVTYRLKDWLLSRQRYWGTPIPIVLCNSCGMVPVPEQDLPVLLPKDVKFLGTGVSPLAQVQDFVNTNCPKCQGPAKRETDTMDTFVDSSWYYARYCDPRYQKAPFRTEMAQTWLPVDLYIGGIEHACMHLIYARFFHKVMRDLGLAPHDEPFPRLVTQGMVTLGGSAMSKSRGNIVEPSEIIEKYGADTARIFILFAAPVEKSLEWSDEGVEGAWRFLNRLWRLVEGFVKESPKPNSQEAKSLLQATHRTIHKVTLDVGGLRFNTAIAAIMTLLNELTSYPALGDPASQEAVESIVLLLAPFAPHICEELWHKLGKNGSICSAAWPKAKASFLAVEEIEIVVQVNGKLRDKLLVGAQTPESDIKEMALASPRVRSYVDGKQVVKTIFVPQKLLNIVIK